MEELKLKALQLLDIAIMNSFLAYKKGLSALMSVFIFILGLQAGIAQSAMVTTESQITTAQANYDRAQLQSIVKSEEARDWLLSLGVSPDTVDQRIANMTPDELAEFNQHLNDMPAGGSIVGVILVVFLVLLVLDLLGTTNVFPVIKPINRY